MSHTPGPWDVSPLGRRNDGSYAVMSALGDDRFAVAYVNVTKPQRRGQAHLAIDHASSDNARLIAAAPDLLEALKRLFATGLVRELDAPEEHAALAAIAKAEGR